MHHRRVALSRAFGFLYRNPDTNVIDELSRRFDALERQRLTLLVDVERSDARQQAFRPAPSKWSLSDVVHHLLLVEEAQLRQAAVAIAAPPPPPGLETRWRLEVLNAVLRSAVRFPAPVRSVIPRDQRDLAVLRPLWDNARGRLGSLLEAVTEITAKDPMFRHPFTGWLTPAQGLAFLWVHAEHHLRQVVRIRRSPGFPNEGEG